MRPSRRCSCGLMGTPRQARMRCHSEIHDPRHQSKHLSLKADFVEPQVRFQDIHEVLPREPVPVACSQDQHLQSSRLQAQASTCVNSISVHEGPGNAAPPSNDLLLGLSRPHSAGGSVPHARQPFSMCAHERKTHSESVERKARHQAKSARDERTPTRTPKQREGGRVRDITERFPREPLLAL